MEKGDAVLIIVEFVLLLVDLFQRLDHFEGLCVGELLLLLGGAFLSLLQLINFRL